MLRVAEKLGFTENVRKKDYCMVDGKLYDAITLQIDLWRDSIWTILLYKDLQIPRVLGFKNFGEIVKKFQAGGASMN